MIVKKAKDLSLPSKIPSSEIHDALLLTLEEASTLVSDSREPRETLDNIVDLIARRFQTDVCSVYFYEPGNSELILGATVGLKAESVGLVRLSITEGLVGLVAQSFKPVMVEDAFSHPRFKYFPEAGEDPFHSFLGVPLVKAGALIGVLVLQTKENRSFSVNETRTLVAVAGQISTIALDAKILLELAKETQGKSAPSLNDTILENKTLGAVVLSPGIGLGRTFALDDLDQWRNNKSAAPGGEEEEKSRLLMAMDQARLEMAGMSKRIAQLLGQDHGAILDAQLMILRDRTIEKDLFLKLKEGLSAENAVVATLDKYLEAFQKIKTPFFQERSFDLKDVFLRIMWNLKPVKNTNRHGDRVVLVCKEASVMELFAVSPEKLAGVIVEKGGPECHAAILARALSIPMVQIPTGFDALLTPGQTVLVAGPNSNVLINPTDETIAEVTKIVAEDVVEFAAPVACDIPPRVLVNINLLWEVPSAINLGVAGVGLFRSEFMLLARRTVPTEEEQVEVYSKLLKSMNGKNTTIRTFDLRPDKVASFSDVGGTASRAYDWRRVLESAPLQKLFMEQLRAIMRAGVDGNPKILIPLVASTEVMDLVLKMYQEARESLVQEKIDFIQNIPLGLMIETAAAIPMIPFWSESVDFLALGTNDLFASVVGIDRNEENQNVLNDHLHPGFLRLVQSAIHYAHEAGKTMTVCGEFASEPLGALFLASMGIDTISVSVQKYKPICNILNKVNREELLKFSNSFIAMKKGDDVRGNLERILKSR